MPKRRSVVLGLGALAFGSGAVSMSGAFTSDFASPEGDLRVIADSQLRVRSARDGTGNPIVASSTSAGDFNVSASDFSIDDTNTDVEGTWSDFRTNDVDPKISDPGQPTVAAVDINEEINDNLVIRTAFSNRILNEEIDPLLEISNNDTSTSYNIKINYAENDSTNTDQIAVGEENGYGADVNAGAGESDFTTSGSDEVSRQVVQAIYQFRMTSTDPAGVNSVPGAADGNLISPDPAQDGSGGNHVDEGAQTYTLGTGETAYIKMDVNTDSDSTVGDLVGPINSAASGGGNVFSGNASLDLLDNIYITAS